MYASELFNRRYAVIEAKWIGRPAERFAVAYCGEESLRELFASPSIVASGFVSYQDALALIPACSVAAPSEIGRTEAGSQSEENPISADPETTELRNCFNLQSLWTMPSRLLHQMAAALVLIVFSKNLFSMALRAFVGI